VLDRALDALIVELEKRKFGSSEDPRPRASASDSRHVPPYLVKQVWAKCGDQCSHPGCKSRWRLEVHHEIPVARGGLTTLENLRLLCPEHHAMVTEQQFGPAFVAGKIQKSG
jgi:5-methylcytosine-specific restriction endonuclease McrA